MCDVCENPLGNPYEIMQPPPQTPGGDLAARRLERWHLQEAARQVLSDERVSICLRRVIPGNEHVKVYRAGQNAHYGGLAVCGSVWVCPVCAAKISERRREELVKAIEEWKKRGGDVWMVTLTVPHYVHQSLSEVLSKFGKGRRLLRNRKPFKRLMKQCGVVGSVRALEVTYGVNGWHVHSHELLFVEVDTSGVNVTGSKEVNTDGFEGVESAILEMWQRACATAGLSVPDEHGVSVHDGSHAGDYAGKWGVEREITKAHLKKGRDGNWSPWDLLRMVNAGVAEAAGLFQEYAKAFKGKRQLVWSDGLRALLGLGEEKKDEEIVLEEDGEEAELLGKLSKQEWKGVVRAKKRGELLEVAVAEGWEGVIRLVARAAGQGEGAMKNRGFS